MTAENVLKQCVEVLERIADALEVDVTELFDSGKSAITCPKCGTKLNITINTYATARLLQNVKTAANNIDIKGTKNKLRKIFNIICRKYST